MAATGCTPDPVDTGTAEQDTGDTGEPVDDLEPPFEATSGGSGGQDHPAGSEETVGGVQTWLIAPTGTASTAGVSLLLVISGTEGGGQMMSNMAQVAPHFELGDTLIAVLDGRTTDAEEAALALDGLREAYDVDNDRTWLLSESAGTRAGLELAFDQRPTWFAAYWANDVNWNHTPQTDAQTLGFPPWGNAGPGGDLYDAQIIVDGMRDAGWSLPADAPYSGPGWDQHGSTDQFLEAVDFFHDKVRTAL